MILKQWRLQKTERRNFSLSFDTLWAYPKLGTTQTLSSHRDPREAHRLHGQALGNSDVLHGVLLPYPSSLDSSLDIVRTLRMEWRVVYYYGLSVERGDADDRLGLPACRRLWGAGLSRAVVAGRCVCRR